MNLTNKFEIKNLLKKYNARPEKYLGQHFILSKKALALMIAAAEIKKNDIIVEIGPGLGTLTQELAKIPHPSLKGGGLKIIAIEKDPLMIKILKETMASHKNVKIIQADARQLLIPRINNFGEKMGINVGKNGYKIVANLPYNVATFLIRSWLEMKNPPETMVLMIQKEVAQRICAKPPKMNLLAVSTQFYAIAEIVKYVPKEMFWPRPKVDAAIIKIIPKRNKNKRNGRIQPIGLKRSLLFFRVVKAGFSSPRKQLVNNLSNKLDISKENLVSIFKNLSITERVRAENLSLEQWQKLALELIHK